MDKAILAHQLYVETGKWLIAKDGTIISAKTGKRLGYHHKTKEYIILGFRTPKTRADNRILAHRLVYYHFNKILTPNMVINHIDAVKINNDPSNLEEITQIENNEHAVRLGLTCYQSMCVASSKKIRLFNSDQIKYIRESSKSTKVLAQELGASKTTISDIRNHKTYKTGL